MRERPRRLLGSLLCFALVAGTAPAAAQTTTPAEQALPVDRASAPVVSPADLEAVRAILPQDPVEAALVLVELIHGPDERVARAATGELLLRAGIPLVSPQGPIVALPGGLVLHDVPVYVQLLNELTYATRAQDWYSVEELAILLQEIGLPPDQPLSAETVVAAFGEWGKGEVAPVESQVAGAALRALAARRGEVLYPGVDPAAITFDPLQTVLVLAHGGSRAMGPEGGEGKAPQVIPGGLTLLERLFGVGTAQAADACKDFQTLAKELKAATTPDNPIVALATSKAQDHLVDKFKEKALTEGERAALKKVKDVKGSWNQATAIVSVILLFLGAKLELRHTSGGTGQWETHFRHAKGEKDKHLHLEAHGKFDSSLAGERLDCYALAGLDVPGTVNLEGFKVRWDLAGRFMGITIQKGGELLAPVSADSHKMNAKGTGGEVLGADGISRLELYPPREKNPPSDPKQREIEGKVVVSAKLDKPELPLSLDDLFSGPKGQYENLFKLALSALNRAALPSERKVITVTYHGTDIFVAKGGGNVFAVSVILPVFLDIYSCTGAEGPWKGRGGFGSWSKTILGYGQESLTGMEIPEGYSMINENINFLVNPGSYESPFPVIEHNNLVSGVMTVDEERLTWKWMLYTLGRELRRGRENLAIPVGEVELLMAGSSFPFADLTYPVAWKMEDPRCPLVEYDYSE